MVAAGGFFGIYQGLIAISRGGVPLFCACNVACQAGEARARAAALRRRAATLQAVAARQPDAIAIFMRHTSMTGDSRSCARAPSQ